MNRRGFFRLMGCAAPTIFIPQVIKPVWNRMVNPAWIDAPYEIALYSRFPFSLARNQVEIMQRQWDIWNKFRLPDGFVNKDSTICPTLIT